MSVEALRQYLGHGCSETFFWASVERFFFITPHYFYLYAFSSGHRSKMSQLACGYYRS